MLDFRLDEEQTMLRDVVARYAREQVRSIYRDAEEEAQIPAAVVQAGWDLGLLPTVIPETWGGLGEYSVLTAAIAAEELAWGDLAVALAVMAPGLLVVPVLLGGSEEQKGQFLPPACGPQAPSFTAAMTEPSVRFSPYQLQTSAVRENGHFVLNGQKTLVPHADRAETLLVYANDGEQTRAYIVPADSEGLSVQDRSRHMGLNGLPTYKVELDNCRVPVANQLGTDQAPEFALLLNHSRVALGACAVGVARAAYEYARDYAKQRVQFGEPIAHRQSIAFLLADMATAVDEARLLVWEAAWLLDQDQDATRETAVMKRYVDDLVLTITDSAVQILGGYGYIREYPVELWLRNARGFASLDGLAIV